MKHYFFRFEGKNILKVSIFGCTIIGYVSLVPTLSALPDVGPYNEKRALQIVSFLMVGGLLLASPTVRRQLFSEVQRFPASSQWGLGLVLAGGVLSSFSAPAPFYALLEVCHFLLLFVTAGAVATAVHRAPRRTERWIFGAVVLGVVLYAVFFGVGYGMHLIFEEIKLWPDGGHKLR